VEDFFTSSREMETLLTEMKCKKQAYTTEELYFLRPKTNFYYTTEELKF